MKDNALNVKGISEHAPAAKRAKIPEIAGQLQGMARIVRKSHRPHEEIEAAIVWERFLQRCITEWGGLPPMNLVNEAA